MNVVFSGRPSPLASAISCARSKRAACAARFLIVQCGYWLTSRPERVAS